MKKSFILFSIIVVILMLSGCINKDEVKTMKCSRTLTQDSVKMTLNYEVDYKGDYVQTVHSVEKIKSSDKSILNSYKKQLESFYSSYKNIEYYSSNVVINGDELVSTVDINYAKIDTDKMIEVDSANALIIKDGKVKIDDVRTTYESLGTICEG